MITCAVVPIWTRASWRSGFRLMIRFRSGEPIESRALAQRPVPGSLSHPLDADAGSPMVGRTVLCGRVHQRDLGVTDSRFQGLAKNRHAHSGSPHFPLRRWYPAMKSSEGRVVVRVPCTLTRISGFRSSCGSSARWGLDRKDLKALLRPRSCLSPRIDPC